MDLHGISWARWPPAKEQLITFWSSSRSVISTVRHYVFYLWIWGRRRLDSKFCSNIWGVKVLIKLRHWNKEVRTIGRQVFVEFDKTKCGAWARARFVELQNKKTMITRGHVLFNAFHFNEVCVPFLFAPASWFYAEVIIALQGHRSSGMLSSDMHLNASVLAVIKVWSHLRREFDCSN